MAQVLFGLSLKRCCRLRFGNIIAGFNGIWLGEVQSLHSYVNPYYVYK